MVIGVDNAGIIEQAKEIVKDNGFGDVITLVRGKMEEVKLPVDKVDIIISEWMGYFLLYESMLDTVLYARDTYLAEGGLIFPDKANLYLTAIEDGEYKEDKINFWDDVYGFSMKPIKDLALLEPLVDTVEPQAIVARSCRILEIDIQTVKKEDLTFEVPFSIEFARKDFCHALVGYFDVEFTHCHKPVVFSTGPRSKYTHWKQTVFYLEDVLTVNPGEKLTGTLSCKPNDKNPRDLDIDVEYKFEGEFGSVQRKQPYKLR
ncbi:PRMT1 [Symbiodinium sp. KB8]|nr:PRMT1 [Symbiodinium sp. KB8]